MSVSLPLDVVYIKTIVHFLEKICSETYEKLTGKVPTVMALHAGLECGLLLDKLPHAEAIS
ncbi:hypothetical protein ACTPEF_23355, partial [Clostridioides difficile]